MTLEKICSGFGISLTEFFDFQEVPGKIDSISLQEQELINCHRSLSASGKKILESYARGICKH